MEHFLRKFAEEFQRPVPVLSEETHRLFQEYSWPGNVRELENAAKAIVALGDEAVAMGGFRAMLMRADHGSNGSRVSLKQAARAASREAEKEMILRGADPHSLESAARRAGLADQLQGFAIQAETDGMLRVRSVLAPFMRRAHEESDEVCLPGTAGICGAGLAGAR